VDYEPVIGLETHAELLTQSKLWCRCSTLFGQPPNSQTCPVCLGMPGVLPVLNREAFELALRAAVALHCTVSPATFFDRKNYYYPDLPKNYQISQNYSNLGVNGHLDIPVDGQVQRVQILNVHLEEDAGKNLHAEHPGADYSLVDLNRAGVPLLEIVSAPDMHSVAEADSYMQTLRQVLLYTGVSNCKMQEGSLRFEASISMRPAGSSELGARVEIKNLNSMKAVCLAIEYEMRRQTALLEDGKAVARETRLWDEVGQRSGRMRSKEEAQDYRYFPEPDLLPVVIGGEMLARAQASVPELPAARRQRFREQFGLSDYDAGVLTDERELADYFEACLRTHNSPKTVANWVMNEVLREVNERKIPIGEFEVGPQRLAELVKLMDEGRVTAQAARRVIAEMVAKAQTITLSPDDLSHAHSLESATILVERLGLGQVSDESALAPVIEQVIRDNPKAAQDYRAGRKQALGALVGQVMRLSRGKADPKLAGDMLRARLEKATE
jgi:aspartyl-tRNA(Asn)/glutamyl-tRNA(Gln) amidotransferase subunit B